MNAVPVTLRTPWSFSTQTSHSMIVSLPRSEEPVTLPAQTKGGPDDVGLLVTALQPLDIPPATQPVCEHPHEEGGLPRAVDDRPVEAPFRGNGGVVVDRAVVVDGRGPTDKVVECRLGHDQRRDRSQS